MKKNVNKQSFTVEQEKTLAQSLKNIIASGFRLVNREIVRAEAKKYWEELHREEKGTRTYVPFKASNGWIMRFKSRHGFTKRKPSFVKKIKFTEEANRENEILDYMCEVEQALCKYGVDYVLNMDETPAKCCGQSPSGWGLPGE
jgi:hypothetical protein